MTGSQVLGIVISVSGTLMAADQIRGLDHALRSRGWRFLGKYRPGRRVTVYYDPAHPHLAVLEPGASFGGLVRVLISGAVVWAGLRVFYGSGA